MFIPMWAVYYIMIMMIIALIHEIVLYIIIYRMAKKQHAQRDTNAILSHVQRFYARMHQIAVSAPLERRERCSAVLQNLLSQLAAYEEHDVHKAIMACVDIHDAVYELQEVKESKQSM